MNIDKKEDIIALLNDGLSITETAKKYNIIPRTLYRRIKRFDINPVEWPVLDKAELASLLVQQLSKEQICEKLGVKHTTLNYYIRLYDLHVLTKLEKMQLSRMGKKFGRLEVVSLARDVNSRRMRYVVKCECGSENTLSWSTLKHGYTKSCGCLKEEFMQRVLLDPHYINARSRELKWYFIDKDGNRQNMRSGFEVMVAVGLEKYGVEFKYEPTVFTLSNGWRYLPDFFIPSQNRWIEVKGVLGKRDAEKHSRFVEDYDYELSIWYLKEVEQYSGIRYCNFLRDWKKEHNIE